MSTEQVRIEDREGVRTVLIDRPAKKNALTSDMYATMAQAFAEADADDAVGAVLLSGSGGVFTAGNDLKDFLDAPPRTPDAPVRRFLDSVAFCSKPLVAAVPGLAVGVGTTILLHCDLVYASPDARFVTPFVNLGLVPEAGSSMLLPRLVGHARAARLLLLGEGIDAATALDWGLVSEVVPAGELEAKAWGTARALAAKPRRAIVESKRLMRAGQGDVARTMQNEFDIFGEMLGTPEAKAAFAAFLSR